MEFKNVTFKAVKSRYENCFCNGCHDTGRVIKLKLPETLYHDHKNLTTLYRNYWLCQKCADKLRTALENPEEEA